MTRRAAFRSGFTGLSGDDHGHPLVRTTAATLATVLVLPLIPGRALTRGIGLLRSRSHEYVPPPIECDHPGIEHGPLSNTGICPRCRRCKFIGHGPLCTDCYLHPVASDVRRDVLCYVRRLIDYGKGHPDADLDSLTLGQVADRIIACVIPPQVPENAAVDCQVGGCRWGDPQSERCECPPPATDSETRTR